jgi:hypothetical protein
MAPLHGIEIVKQSKERVKRKTRNQGEVNQMETEKEIVAEGKDLKKQFKRWYQTPQLIIHGSVEKITEGINPGSVDGRFGSRI